jgi:phosphatidylglycerophosphate synthase
MARGRSPPNNRASMKIWIDAAAASGAVTVFGLTTVERLLRSIDRAILAPAEVVLSGGAAPRRVPAGLVVRQEPGTGAAGERLAGYVAAADDTVLAFDGASVVDERLIEFLARGKDAVAALGGAASDPSAVLRLPAAAADAVDGARPTVADVARAAIDAKAVRELTQSEFPSFIANLRRELPFYLFRVRNEAESGKVERFLFLSNYKGSTDFLTKWVYPPLVWRLTRWATRARIHPNLITIASILLAALAVPLFAAGDWIAGFLAAYAMSVLDSVDGKVARVTLTDSWLGNLLDHGLDILHPPFWYFAIAWGISGGDMATGPFIAAVMLFFIYVADRLILMVSKARWGYGLHAHAPIDARIRTWIARRNTNLVLLTIGYIVGRLPEAFYLVLVWQGLTLVWHVGRTLWLLKHKPAPVPR